jgi:hypothetical protein
MVKYLLGLAIAIGIFALPQSRKAAFQLLGLVLIATVGVAIVGLPVWALYEARPWLTAQDETLADSELEASDSGPGDSGGGLGGRRLSPLEEAERRRLEQEQRRLAEEKRREEEQRRIASIAEAARAIVEKDRKYASLAASSVRLPGADAVMVDLITIRIPSWRDEALAEREQGLIRTWLHSIGLKPEETASIATANGWGSVYDLWREENPDAAEGPALEVAAPVAPATEQAPAIDQEPRPELDLEPAPVVRQAERPRYVPRRPAEARPRPVVPRSVPRRAPAPPTEVGPFGY